VKARRHFVSPAHFLLLASFLAALASKAENLPEEGPQPELTLDLEHHNGMGGTFALVSADYLLDGKELVRLKGTDLRERMSRSRLMRTPLPPGLHVIAMRLIYIGHSGVFRYVDRYRFTMQGYLLVESRTGYGVKVISNAQEKKSVTVQWQNRPTFQLGGLPKKAILSVKVSPIQRDASPGEGDEDLPPLAIAISEEDAKLLEGHLHEDAPEAPAPKPAPAQAAVDAPGCREVVVRFAFGKSRLDRAARRSLEHLSACLIRAPAKQIRVEGHCDARGSHALNDRLGQARADSAARFLVLRGVMPDRLESVSFGKRRPVCTERTEACYARNRRAQAAAVQGGLPSATEEPPPPPTAKRF
jgi:peptidoglycan-associated lipoprotein